MILAVSLGVYTATTLSIYRWLRGRNPAFERWILLVVAAIWPIAFACSFWWGLTAKRRARP